MESSTAYVLWIVSFYQFFFAHMVSLTSVTWYVGICGFSRAVYGQRVYATDWLVF